MDYYVALYINIHLQFLYTWSLGKVIFETQILSTVYTDAVPLTTVHRQIARKEKSLFKKTYSFPIDAL